MSNSEPLRSLAIGLLLAWPTTALAEAAAASGFALERRSPAPAGSGWIAGDDLDWDPGFGGAIALTTSYARDPLVVTQDGSGGQSLTVVSDELIANVGLSASFDRFRLSLNLASPIWLAGHSGTLGQSPLNAGTQFAAPAVDLGKFPDLFADASLGLVARILPEPAGHHRLALGAQLFLPSGDRANYLTDDTYRAIFRLLYASEVGSFRFAGQFGFHLRPLDDSTTPGSPRGNELVFAEAAGIALPVGAGWTSVVGLEVTGATAFNAFLGNRTTAAETMLAGRLETVGPGRQVRVKLGIGGALQGSEFGAPLWRLVLGVELFDRGEAAK